MRRSKLVTLMAIGTTVVMLAAACSSGDKSSSDSKDSTTTGGGNAGKPPAAVPGFDGTTINLGVVTPQSGAVGKIAGDFIGKPLTDGNQTYWDMKNAAGGVDGKYKVSLKIADSKYDPIVGAQAYESLKTDVVAFQQILGTQITTAIEPQLAADNVVASPATLDAEWALDANLLPFSTTYQLLAINGLNYYLKNGGKGKNICTLSQDDAYGQAGQAGAEYAATKLGFTLKTKQTVKLLGDKTAAVQALKDNQCDAVLVTLLFADMGSLIKTATQASYTARLILEPPAYDASLLKDPAQQAYLETNAWVLGAGPQWADTTNKGMKTMTAQIKKYRPTQTGNLYFLFGYAQAWAMDQLLEQAVKNGDLSKDGLQTAMDKIGTLKFDDLLPDYVYGASVSDRVPPPYATIFAIEAAQDGGLKALEVDYTSAAAKSYKFTK